MELVGFDALVGEAFVAIVEIDDAAIGEAVFGDVVLHDEIVPVGVDAYVGVVEPRKKAARRSPFFLVISDVVLITSRALSCRSGCRCRG